MTDVAEKQYWDSPLSIHMYIYIKNWKKNAKKTPQKTNNIIPFLLLVNVKYNCVKHVVTI